MYFEVFSEREGCGPGEVRMGNRKVLMFGSNDYLDLITHPKVKEAAIDAVRKYGSGCSGSRLLNGTLDVHVKLEAELAAFVHKEAAIIFGTGFQANYASLAALAEKGDALLCDHNLHASLVEGALRSTARTVRFRHNDLDHLERCLENCPPEERILIVSEGVFSMEGDIADLRGIVAWPSPTARASTWMKRTASACWDPPAPAPPSTWACWTMSTSSWARSASRWPRWAASWRPPKRWSIT
jgi:8-amino-7-oxononanoate synthase